MAAFAEAGIFKWSTPERRISTWLPQISRRISSRLIQARLAARAEKNWAESDRVRDQLTAMGVVLEDGKGGTTWRLAE